MVGIYKIENLVNGKVYIGQSTQIKTRWREHLYVVKNKVNPAIQRPLYQAFLKYGIENFSFEIIELCKIDELNQKETYWINYYNSCVFSPNSNGYNLTFGGDNNSIITEEELQQMVKLWHDGYTTTQIGQQLGYTRPTIRKKLKDICDDYSPEEGAERGKNHSHGERKVNQYDLNGNFIKTFPSLKSAAEETDAPYSDIKRAAHGTHITSKKYIYIFYDEDQETVLKSRLEARKQQLLNNKSYHPVEQIDINTGEVICLFESCTAAAEACGHPSGRKFIAQCCKGLRENKYGYKWRYANVKNRK